MARRGDAPRESLTASVAQAVHAEVQPAALHQQDTPGPLPGRHEPQRDALASCLVAFHFEFAARGRAGHVPSNRAARSGQDTAQGDTSPQGQ